MYYKIYPTEEEAKEVSQQEALDRGCSGTTQYWWSWQVHPETGECALKRPDQPIVSQEMIEVDGEMVEQIVYDDTWTDTLDASWFPKDELGEESSI